MAERNFGKCPAYEDECGFTVASPDVLAITGDVGAFCVAGLACAAPERDAAPATASTAGFNVVGPNSAQLPGDTPVTISQLLPGAEGGQV